MLQINKEQNQDFLRYWNNNYEESDLLKKKSSLMQFSIWHSLYSAASILILQHQGMFHMWENRKLVWGANAETLHWKAKRCVLNFPGILTKISSWLQLAIPAKKHSYECRILPIKWDSSNCRKSHRLTQEQAEDRAPKTLWIYEQVWCDLLEKSRNKALFPFQMLPLDYEAVQQTDKSSMLTLARC